MSKKLSKLESHMEQKARVERAISGTGRYTFKNRTRGEVILPKVGLDGKKKLKSGETFIGDSYFLSLVPNMLLIVDNLDSKEKVVADKPQILLTEQPPVYTQKGHVEYVQEDPNKKLVTEQPKKEGRLLVEPANDSVMIIR